MKDPLVSLGKDYLILLAVVGIAIAFYFSSPAGTPAPGTGTNFKLPIVKHSDGHYYDQNGVLVSY